MDFKGLFQWVFKTDFSKSVIFHSILTNKKSKIGKSGVLSNFSRATFSIEWEKWVFGLGIQDHQSISQSVNLGPTQPTTFLWKSGVFIGKSYPVGVVVQFRVVDLTMTEGKIFIKFFDHGWTNGKSISPLVKKFQRTFPQSIFTRF